MGNCFLMTVKFLVLFAMEKSVWGQYSYFTLSLFPAFLFICGRLNLQGFIWSPQAVLVLVGNCHGEARCSSPPPPPCRTTVSGRTYRLGFVGVVQKFLFQTPSNIIDGKLRQEGINGFL